MQNSNKLDESTLMN